ncbi:hypothetical protein BZG35_08410 [Brevundimonas sp. LM2]|uniref:hypothetical protein n=1 Tax=Brevundimonas sp. LM2 TaxID=1938605 RepID=UPI000983B8F8|nr:hypothetical protein [Brevundimonas sp. LM2]AQR61671.1 hypothetical protein BZG35_08410 [Brevundimonas sp. LM2]
MTATRPTASPARAAEPKDALTALERHLDARAGTLDLRTLVDLRARLLTPNPFPPGKHAK